MENQQITKFISLLEVQINKVDILMNDQQIYNSPEFKEWDTTTQNLVRRIFGEKSNELKQTKFVQYYPNTISEYTPFEEEQKAYRDGLIEIRAILKSHKQQLLDLGLMPEKPLVQRISHQVNVNNKQEQNNQQSQSFTLNLETDFSKIIDRIKGECGDEEQVKKAEITLAELESELKKTNPTWSVIKKGLEQTLSFGKGVAVEVMAEVVKKLYLP